MINAVLNSIGWILARSPVFMVEGLCKVAGCFIYTVFAKRRRVMLANLHHAFPEKSQQQRCKIARTSCMRMAEMALMAIASPFFSKKRIRKCFALDPSTDELHKKELVDPNTPSIFLVPHFSLSEANTLLPGCVDHEDYKKTAVFFRPLNQPKLDAWVKKTRERFGLKLLSRKSGLNQAFSFLKDNQAVAILFDQNAGLPGALTLLLNRLASSTHLPDLLHEKYPSNVYMFWIERSSFWRGTLHAKKIHTADDKDETPIIVKANDWLSTYLRGSDEQCADWLWYHNRWRTQDPHYRRFRIESKRSYLKESLSFHAMEDLPKNTHVMIRLPNWLGDIVMALPVIQSLKKARPDFRITFLCQKGAVSFIEPLNIADEIIPLPKKGLGYYFNFFKLRKHYPDVHILFTNSFRGDLEARIIGAPQRFGIERPKRRRPLLTHSLDLSKEYDEAKNHQTRLWYTFFQHFGLQEPLDLTPFGKPEAKGRSEVVIGLICGTENTPAKRWPVPHWRTLISHLGNYYQGKPNAPKVKIRLFGTPMDKLITDQVAQGSNPEVVENLAGRTSLKDFARYLTECDTVICNDTGGMHLANALGVPTVSIFGPTNPIRTGPIFESKKTILQPPNCPPTGGGDIQEVTPLSVLEAALTQLELPAKQASAP